MKQSNICPKCQSSDVVRIPPFKGTSTSSMIQLTKWGTNLTYFDRYICASCGFIEHYANMEERSWQKWLEEQKAKGSLDSNFV
ncbi:MAG TPA: hypothetical protein VFG10_18335 [Saprospiraceae bacterium]|nr:hypothetical protein [Saprospiraceae bacterium]